MVDTELAWAAGFFDGEGCTMVQRRAGRVISIKIVIGQQHDEVLLRFQKAVGVGNVVYPKSLKPDGRTRAIHLNICGKEKVLHTLKLIWPYLGSVKREQANRKLKELKNG